MKKINSKSSKYSLLLTLLLAITLFLSLFYMAFIKSDFLTSKNNVNLNSETLLSSFADENSGSEITIPSYYSLRDEMLMMTEDQNSSGLCWNFTCNKVLESLFAKTYNTYIDFSDTWVALTNKCYAENISKESYLIGSGGKPSTFINVIDNYGIMLEEDFSQDNIYYLDSDNYEDYYEMYKDYATMMYSEKIDLVALMTDASFSEEEILRTKNHLLNYSALYLRIESTQINDDYVYDTTLSINISALQWHAVTLIGWDDSFSYTDSIGEEHTGAWIALNSWNENWGNDGIFYIPYDSTGTIGDCYGFKFSQDFNDISFSLLDNDSSDNFTIYNKYEYTSQYETTSGTINQYNVFALKNQKVSVNLEYKIENKDLQKDLNFLQITRSGEDLTSNFDVELTSDSLIISSLTTENEWGAYKIEIEYGENTLFLPFYIVSGAELSIVRTLYSSNPYLSYTSRYLLANNLATNNTTIIEEYIKKGAGVESYDSSTKNLLLINVGTYSRISYILPGYGVTKSEAIINNSGASEKVFNSSTSLTYSEGYFYLTFNAMTEGVYNFNFTLKTIDGNTQNYKIVLYRYFIVETKSTTEAEYYSQINESILYRQTRMPINYVDSGACNQNPQAISYNYLSSDNTIDLIEPKKVGYIFVGWYLDKDYTNEITKISKDLITEYSGTNYLFSIKGYTNARTKVINIYAKFIKVDIRIQIDFNLYEKQLGYEDFNENLTSEVFIGNTIKIEPVLDILIVSKNVEADEIIYKCTWDSDYIGNSYVVPTGKIVVGENIVNFKINFYYQDIEIPLLIESESTKEFIYTVKEMVVEDILDFTAEFSLYEKQLNDTEYFMNSTNEVYKGNLVKIVPNVVISSKSTNIKKEYLTFDCVWDNNYSGVEYILTNQETVAGEKTVKCKFNFYYNDVLISAKEENSVIMNYTYIIKDIVLEDLIDFSTSFSLYEKKSNQTEYTEKIVNEVSIGSYIKVNLNLDYIPKIDRVDDITYECIWDNSFNGLSFIQSKQEIVLGENTISCKINFYNGGILISARDNSVVLKTFEYTVTDMVLDGSAVIGKVLQVPKFILSSDYTITYEWYKNSNKISNKTTNELSIIDSYKGSTIYATVKIVNKTSNTTVLDIKSNTRNVLDTSYEILIDVTKLSLPIYNESCKLMLDGATNNENVNVEYVWKYLDENQNEIIIENQNTDTLTEISEELKLKEVFCEITLYDEYEKVTVETEKITIIDARFEGEKYYGGNLFVGGLPDDYTYTFEWKHGDTIKQSGITNSYKLTKEDIDYGALDCTIWIYYNSEAIAGIGLPTLTSFEKRNVIIKIDDKSSLYGESLKELTYTFEENAEIFSEDLAYFDIKLTKDEGLIPNKYNIEATCNVLDESILKYYNLPTSKGSNNTFGIYEILKLDINLDSILLMEYSSQNDYNDELFVYDGQEKKVILTNLPSQLSNVVIKNNVYTDAGNYIVEIVSFDYDSVIYNEPDFSNLENLKWKINKKIIGENIKWDYTDKLTYTGEELKVELVNLPTNVVAHYINNIKIIPGEYVASVVFEYDTLNYELSSNVKEIETLNWIIDKMDNAIYLSSSKNYGYDGLEKEIIAYSDYDEKGENLTYILAYSDSIVNSEENRLKIVSKCVEIGEYIVSIYCEGNEYYKPASFSYKMRILPNRIESEKISLYSENGFDFDAYIKMESLSQEEKQLILQKYKQSNVLDSFKVNVINDYEKTNEKIVVDLKMESSFLSHYLVAYTINSQGKLERLDSDIDKSNGIIKITCHNGDEIIIIDETKIMIIILLTTTIIVLLVFAVIVMIRIKAKAKENRKQATMYNEIRFQRNTSINIKNDDMENR